MTSSAARRVAVGIAVHCIVLGALANDLACSLNGVQVSGTTCKCDAPWKGPTCSVLDIKRRPSGAAPAMYGYSPNVTSWGGNVVAGDDGLYHLYVSEMVGGCGLNTWSQFPSLTSCNLWDMAPAIATPKHHHHAHNSRIIHATSPTLDLTTPFTFKDAALEVWAHNAAPVRAPSTHTECPGCYYLFHIGSGSTSTPPQNCTDGSRVRNSPSYDGTHEVMGGVAGVGGGGGLVHRSKSPNGPWEPLPSSMGCNNPAPAFAKNGTLFVLCSSSSIWRAEGVASGNWTKIVDINLNDSPWTGGAPSEYIRVEDPYLWCDENDNWHLFCHRYDYRDGWPPNPNQTDPVLVSGHAFSEDLFSWHYSSGPQPFDPWVFSEDGTRLNYSTFERPHLIFNEAGIPTHTVHGVSPVWAQYDDHHPCEVCPARPGTQHSCVVCKSSEYYSWTYTLMQELNVP